MPLKETLAPQGSCLLRAPAFCGGEASRQPANIIKIKAAPPPQAHDRASTSGVAGNASRRAENSPWGPRTLVAREVLVGQALCQTGEGHYLWGH